MKLNHRVAQGDTRLALGTALARFKADNEGVTDADIEHAKGLHAGMISLELNEHVPLKVSTLTLVMEAMDGEYLEPLYALCARFGRRPERVKPYDGADIASVHAAISAVIKEFSEALQAVMDGVKDGRMEGPEITRAVKEARELQLAIDGLLGALLALKADTTNLKGARS